MNDIRTALRQTAIQSKEAELLLSHVLKKDHIFIKARPDFKLSRAQLLKFKSLEKRRTHNEPIAYILKSQPFYGQPFMVNRHTLIPRPETEYLVDIIKKDLTNKPSKKLIIDVGTGSGCLSITLKLQIPNATVIASDISRKALNVARKNSRSLKAEAVLVQDDLLGDELQSKIHQTLKKTFFDRIVLVANLPYLPTSYKKDMAPDVVDYEPSTALFAGSDGLMLINKLLTQISKSKLVSLIKSAYLEIDPSQSKKLTKIIKKLFPSWQVRVLPDLAGRPRYLVISA